MLALPTRIKVKSVAASRYRKQEGYRPASWEQRKSGIDSVKTTSGEVINLFSDGQQSTPESGWEILLTGGNDKDGYSWTLYGITKLSSEDHER